VTSKSIESRMTTKAAPNYRTPKAQPIYARSSVICVAACRNLQADKGDGPMGSSKLVCGFSGVEYSAEIGEISQSDG
jgi:hypothetical protein